MNNTPFFQKIISLFYRVGQMFLDKELTLYHIGPSQFYILTRLYHLDKIDQESLSQSVRISKNAVARYYHGI